METITRRLRLALAAAVVGLGACGTGGEVGTERPSVDPATSIDRHDAGDHEILAVWTMSGGECPECAFSATFLVDGTLLWSSGFGGSVVRYDPTDALAVSDTLTADALTDGTDDCEREIDGNAPSLLVIDRDGQVLKIDTCYRELDEDHPFTQLTRVPDEGARDAAVPFVAAIGVPDEDCEPNTDEPCPETVYELYADGLVLVATPSIFAGDAALPTSAQRVEQRLVDELAHQVDRARLAINTFCRPDPSGSGAKAEDGVDADQVTAEEKEPWFWVDTRYPGFGAFGDLAECAFEPDHPAVPLLDELIPVP